MKFAKLTLAPCVLLFALGVCPGPQPPQPDPGKIWVVVRSQSSALVPNATVVLDAPAGAAKPTATTDEKGEAVLTSLGPGPSHLWVTAAGYLPHDQHVDVGVGDLTLTITLTPEHKALPTLTADGRVFRLPDGTIWRWRGLTAFTLFKRYLDGEDIRPFLQFARTRGNVVRVLCRVSWGKLDPRHIPNYDAKLHDFLMLLEDYQLRAELTVLADCQPEKGAYALDAAGQRALLSQISAATADHANVFLEFGNEWFKNGWTCDVRPDALPAPPLQSRGCGGEDDPPCLPGLTYATFHAGRQGEWVRKQGKQACEWSWGCGSTPPSGKMGIPIVDDEPQKIVGGERDNPSDFYTAFALSALFTAGATIHFQQGLQAQVPLGRELEAVNAAAEALREIPLDAPLGSYMRGPSSACPLWHTDITEDPDGGALRTFCQLFAHKAYCVVVQPGPHWVAKTHDNWRITERQGGGGKSNVVFLER